MIQSEILQTMQQASIQERINLIELLLQSLKDELTQVQPAQANEPTAQRRTFGCMKETGQIQGDIVSPALTESEWEVLQ
ncbi:hypothetical protein PGN35_000210 [Nodosilinea sp. PGN35]|uniref:hypothetical protein n=1 Tax=Nodosilinea sp. PGN35 TaxID=3020489 RepID=UPI0023B2F5F9|nr:hypothetical protein [Nodosilinea sp. TSF1-S3]MDF0369164.1 hypothetical protein [Nodosilinea sp. TSF1-S3]